MSLDDDLLRRALDYTQRRGRRLGKRLGAGAHGSVYATEFQPENRPAAIESAIKVFRQEAGFIRERDVYLRLRDRGIQTVLSCNVPSLIEYDDKRWIVEMTVVTRPFVLDFAGAYLDRAPSFPEEVMVQWHLDKSEEFGANWPRVQAILAAFQKFGVFMIDVNPGNVSFGE
jgi:hypothetical protein